MTKLCCLQEVLTVHIQDCEAFQLPVCIRVTLVQYLTRALYCESPVPVKAMKLYNKTKFVELITRTELKQVTATVVVQFGPEK